MGGTQAVLKRRLDPDERRELRRNYNAGEDFASGIEHSADKYDYLIIFAVYKEGRRGNASSHNGGGGDGLLTWEHAKQLWYQCIPGDDKEKEEAVTQLQAAWQREFVSTETVVSFGKFVELVRNSVIEILSQKSGLQLRRSRRKGSIYYRLRAPVRLLEQHAAAIGYRLQLKPEVDPGPDFWTEEEVEEENTEYSRDRAEEVLEELFHVSKISPNDLTIFEDEVNSKQWSCRIHTLERIADRVPVTNRYPAYTPFVSNPKLRHLFQTYQSVRGRTLFKSKDRLFLTKSILQSYIDFAVLEARGIVQGVTALHDASRGEAINADLLVRRWVTPWREHLDRVGAPYVSALAMDEGQPINPFLLPWSQPLEDARDYFGEKIAIYFAWIGFYAYALIIPAILGLFLQIYIYAYLGTDYVGLDWVQIGVAIFTCVWATVYKKCWDRELRAVAIKWGMEHLEDLQRNRPDFVGDPSSGDNGRYRSPVTNRMETYYPEWKRGLKQTVSFIVMLVAVGLVAGIIELLMWSWAELEASGFEYSELVISLALAVEIRIMSYFYQDIAVLLNNWENYQTDTAYEDSLIFKTFFFQIVNNYGALVYVAFLKGPIYGCSGDDSGEGSCMTDLTILMVIIFVVRLLNGLSEILAPLVRRLFRQSGDDLLAMAGDDASVASSTEEGTGSEIVREDFEQEVHLETYEGTFDDYAEIILQYGYVTMFLLAFPLASLLALIENLVQMRSDAYKILRLYRRPDSLPAEDIGMWAHVQDTMGWLAVLTNVGIIVFTTDSLVGYNEIQMWLIFLVAEQGLMAIKVALQILIPDEADEIPEIKQRNKFIITKHIYGFTSDDASAGAGGSLAKVGGDIDIDSLSLEGADKPLSTDEAGQLEALEKKRRDVDRELSIAKEQLQQAMQTEVYNEKTGVGETKYGLPLGFINIQLLALDDVDIKDEDGIVVISIRSTKGDSVPPGPPPKHSNPGRREPSSARQSGQPPRLEFNQSFQLAPIRTQDAEIIFDILDRSAEPSKIGTVRVELRELASQETIPFNKPLTLMDKSGKPIPTKGMLYFKARFQFSKVVPLRKKIYQLADQKRTLEKEMTLLRVGRSKK